MKRVYHRLVFVVIFLLPGLASHSQHLTDNQINELNDYLAGIFRVEAGGAFGTAFLVADVDEVFFAVSAHHVVDDFPDDTIYLVSFRDNKRYVAEVYKVLAEDDLVFLRAIKDAEFNMRRCRVDYGELNIGDSLFIPGYPGGGDLSVFGGVITHLDGDKIFITESAALRGGYSGAPVIRKYDFSVVGIALVQGVDGAEDKAYLTSAIKLLLPMRLDKKLSTKERPYRLDDFEFYGRGEDHYLDFFEGLDLSLSYYQSIEKIKQMNQGRKPQHMRPEWPSYGYRMDRFPTTLTSNKGNATIFVKYDFKSDRLAALTVNFRFYTGTFRFARVSRRANVTMIKNQLTYVFGNEGTYNKKMRMTTFVKDLPNTDKVIKATITRKTSDRVGLQIAYTIERKKIQSSAVK